MRVDENPRFPADAGSLIRKLTDLFRQFGQAVNGVIAGTQRLAGALIGSTTDYTQFEADGTMIAKGKATCWDDLFVPLTTSKKGANDLPDFDYTNGGFLFPQNDTAERLYFVVQFPHRWAGTTVYPHVHYKRTVAGKPVFKLLYSWFAIGGAAIAPATTIIMDSELVTYSSGSIHQINDNATGIAGTGKGISSIMVCELFRDDNTVAGDVLAYQMDFHFEIDTLGSRTQYAK